MGSNKLINQNKVRACFTKNIVNNIAFIITAILIILVSKSCTNIAYEDVDINNLKIKKSMISTTVENDKILITNKVKDIRIKLLYANSEARNLNYFIQFQVPNSLKIKCKESIVTNTNKAKKIKIDGDELIIEVSYDGEKEYNEINIPYNIVAKNKFEVTQYEGELRFDNIIVPVTKKAITYNDIVYNNEETTIEVNNYQNVSFNISLMIEAKIDNIEDILIGTNKLRIFNLDSHISINNENSINEKTILYKQNNVKFENTQNGVSKAISTMALTVNFKLLNEDTGSVNKTIQYEITNSESMYKPIRGEIRITIKKLNLDIKFNDITVESIDNQQSSIVIEVYEKQKLQIKMPEGLKNNNRDYYFEIVNPDEFLKYFDAIGRVKLASQTVNNIELNPMDTGENNKIEYVVFSKEKGVDNQPETEEIRNKITVDIKNAEIKGVNISYKINSGEYSQEIKASKSTLEVTDAILIKPLDTLSISIKTQDIRDLTGRKLEIVTNDNNDFLSYFNIIEPTFINYQAGYEVSERIVKLVNKKTTNTGHKSIKFNIVNDYFQPTSIGIKYISKINKFLYINQDKNIYNNEINDFNINTEIVLKFKVETSGDDENVYSIVIKKNSDFANFDTEKAIDMQIVNPNNKDVKAITINTTAIKSTEEVKTLSYQVLVRNKNNDISKAIVISEENINYKIPQGSYDNVHITYRINNKEAISKEISKNSIIVNGIEMMPLDLLHISLNIEDTRTFTNRKLKIIKDITPENSPNEYFDFKEINSDDSYSFNNRELTFEMLNINRTGSDWQDIVMKVVNERFSDVNIVIKYRSTIDAKFKIDNELYSDNTSIKLFQVNKAYNFQFEIETLTKSNKNYELEFIGDDLRELFITKTVDGSEINNFKFIKSIENSNTALAFIFIPIKHVNEKEITYRVKASDDKGNKTTAYQNTFKYSVEKGSFDKIKLNVNRDGMNPYTIDDITNITANENVFTLSPLDAFTLRFVINTEENINTITKLKFDNLDVVNEYFDVEKVGSGQLYAFNNKELTLNFHNKKRTDLDKKSDTFKTLTYSIENVSYPKVDAVMKFQSQLTVKEYVDNNRYSENGLNVYEIDSKKDLKIEFNTNIADNKKYIIKFESEKNDDFIIKNKDGVIKEEHEFLKVLNTAVQNINLKLIPTVPSNNMLLKYNILTASKEQEDVIVYNGVIKYKVIEGEFQQVKMTIIRPNKNDIIINDIANVDNPKIVLMPLETVEIKFEIPNIENINTDTYLSLAETSDLFEYFDIVDKERIYLYKFDKTPLTLKLINKKITNSLETKTIKYEITNVHYLNIEKEIRYESKSFLKYTINNRDYPISRIDGFNRIQTVNIEDRVTFKMNEEIVGITYYLKFDDNNEYETYFLPVKNNEFNSKELTIPFTPIKVQEDIAELPFTIYAKKNDESYKDVIAYKSKMVFKTVKNTYDSHTIKVRVNSIAFEPIDFKRINYLELKPLDKVFVTVELQGSNMRRNSKFKFLQSEQLYKYFDVYDNSNIDEKNKDFYEFTNRSITVVLKSKKINVGGDKMIKYEITNVDYESINKEMPYEINLIMENNINEIIDVNDKMLKGEIDKKVLLSHKIKNISREIPINSNVKYYVDFEDKSVFNEYFVEVEEENLIFDNAGMLNIILHPKAVIRKEKTIKYNIYAKEKDIFSTVKGILSGAYAFAFQIEPSTYQKTVYIDNKLYDGESINNIKVYDTINVKFNLSDDVTYHTSNVLTLVNYNVLINHFTIKRKGTTVASDTMIFNDDNEVLLQFISKKSTSSTDNIISYSIKSSDLLDYNIAQGSINYHIEKQSYNNVEISMKIKNGHQYANSRDNNLLYKNEDVGIFIKIGDHLKGNGDHYFKIKNWEVIKNNFINQNIYNLNTKQKISPVETKIINLKCSNPVNHIPIEIEVSEAYDNYEKAITVVNTKIISRDIGINIQKDIPQENIDNKRRIDIEIIKDVNNKENITAYKFKIEKRASSTVNDDNNSKITIKGKSNTYNINTEYNITDDIIDGQSKIFFNIELQEYTIGRYDLILKIINTDSSIISKPFTIENVGFFARLTNKNNLNSFKVRKNIELPIHIQLDTNIPKDKLKWEIPENNEYYTLDTSILNSENLDLADIVIKVKNTQILNQRKFITIKAIHKDFERYAFDVNSNTYTFEITENIIAIAVDYNPMESKIGDDNDDNKIYKGDSKNQWVYDIDAKGDDNFEQKEYEAEIYIKYKALNINVYNNKNGYKHLDYIKNVTYEIVNKTNKLRLIINSIAFNKIGDYTIDVLIREKNTGYTSPRKRTEVKVYDFTPNLQLDLVLSRDLVINNVQNPTELTRYDVYQKERVTISYENNTTLNSNFIPEYIITKSNKDNLAIFNENKPHLSYSNVGRIEFTFNKIIKTDNFYIDITLKEMNTGSQITKRISLRAVKENLEAIARIRKPMHNKDLENKKIKILLTNINSLQHISANDLEYTVTPKFYNSSDDIIVLNSEKDIIINDFKPKYNQTLNAYFIDYNITNLPTTVRKMKFLLKIKSNRREIERSIYTNSVDIIPIESTEDILRKMNNDKTNIFMLTTTLHRDKNILPLGNKYRFQIQYNHYSRYVENANLDEDSSRFCQEYTNDPNAPLYLHVSRFDKEDSTPIIKNGYLGDISFSLGSKTCVKLSFNDANTIFSHGFQYYNITENVDKYNSFYYTTVDIKLNSFASYVKHYKTDRSQQYYFILEYPKNPSVIKNSLEYLEIIHQIEGLLGLNNTSKFFYISNGSITNHGSMVFNYQGPNLNNNSNDKRAFLEKFRMIDIGLRVDNKHTPLKVLKTIDTETATY